MMVELLGILAVFTCPMIFGGITFYYSWKVVDEWERETNRNDV